MRINTHLASFAIFSLYVFGATALFGGEEAAGGSAAAWQAISNGSPVRVAVFVGPGARGIGMFRWTQIVDQSPQLKAIYVDGAAVRAGALRGADLLAMPGGVSNIEADDLGEEGAREVRRFIEEGGSYIGTCAGAFLVLGGKNPEKKTLGLVPYRHVSGHWGGEAMLQVKYLKDAEAMAGIKSDTYMERFNGGPVMEPGAAIPGADFKTMAEFRCNLHSNSCKTNLPSMGGYASAVAGTFGKGRVWIFAGHPEYYPKTWPSLKAAFRFTTGRDVEFSAPQRRRGQLAVGWWCSPGMGVEGAELARKLVRGEDCDVVPYSFPEIKRMDLRHVDVLVVPDTRDTNVVNKLVRKTTCLGQIHAFMDRGGKVVTWGSVAKSLGSHANLVVADAAASVPDVLRSIKNAPPPSPREGPAPKVANPIRVAEYMGPGAAGAASLRWAKLLSLSPECEYTAIDEKDVRGGALKNFDVYIAPGGNANEHGGAIGSQGLSNVVEFVRGGGGYFGSCAGCYLSMTLSDTDKKKAKRLGLIPYHAQKCPYRGGSELELKFTEHAGMFGLKPGSTRDVRYHGGPVLLPLPSASNSDIRVIATYNCDGVYSYNTRREPTMAGTPAIVAGTFGKGRVVSISPHPEGYDHTQDIIRGGLKYITGRDFKSEYPQRTRGNLTVAFHSSHAGKDGAMLAMRLLREPSLDVHLIDNGDFGNGDLEHCDVIVLGHPKKSYFTDIVRAFAKNGGSIVVFGSEKELAKVPADVPGVTKCRDEESVIRHLVPGEGRDWSEIYLGSHPCVAPDGKTFAFEWKDRIWLAPTDGGTAVPLGDGTSDDTRPYISPDSRRIAFLSDRWGSRQLFEADLDMERLVATNTRQVTFHTESLVTWGYTPDGSQMIALAYRDDGPESPKSMLNSRRPILVSMEGRKAERLVFDAPAFSPALSPDGRKVLFAANVAEKGLEQRKRSESSLSPYAGDIWLYDMDKKKFSAIVEGKADFLSPVWTPDGKGFYYLSNDRGVRNVRHRSLETGADREVTHFTDDHVFTPSLSRDGKTMVFAKGFDMWRIDPTDEKAEPRRIVLKSALFDPSAPRSMRRSYTTMDNNYGDGNCTFRDKGKEVAFTAGGDLWVAETKDDNRQVVCLHGSSRTHERDCAFTPDGSTLYYLSDKGDGTDVWRIRRADTNRLWSANTDFIRERLIDDDECRRALTISPDGRLLAWRNMQGRLSFADTNGVVKSVAKVESSSGSSYAWSPDGRYVAATLTDSYGNDDVWVIPTWDADEKGKAAPAPCNISRNWKWDGLPAWSSDGRVVAFSGDRTATGDVSYIFYAYLDPADEAAEADGGKVRKEKCRPDLSTLPERVRATGVRGYRLLFAPEGRKLSFYEGKKMWTIEIPGRMKPEKLLDRSVKLQSWTKDGKKDVFLGSFDDRPSIGEKSYRFPVYQTTDIHDYQELAFLTDWAMLRDGYCDPGMNGVDWKAVREKYRLAARYAPSWSAFAQVVRMMHAELDSSHLGFSASDVAKKRWASSPWDRGWKLFTVHLGIRFDRSYKGDGWRVRDVIPRTSADRGEKGVLPGDIVMSVDGRKVMPGMDYAEVMNGPLPHKFRLELKRGKKSLVREVDGMSFRTAREHMYDAYVERNRALVRKRGNFGYISLDAMNDKNADNFTDAVFAECFDRKGLIVDVRFNVGGNTADRLVDILCGSRHVRSLYRGMESEGYLMERYGRPVVAEIPVVVIANERTFSNGEVFASAMHTLKRGKVVGRPTAGEVISTVDRAILDYGNARLPRIGVFRMDGTDTEGNPAIPDVDVPMTPEDIAAGRDPQLDAAIDLLAAEATRPSLPPLKY